MLTRRRSTLLRFSPVPISRRGEPSEDLMAQLVDRELIGEPDADRSTPVEPGHSHEAVFLTWLADLSGPDQVRLGGDLTATPMTTLLGLLCISPVRLPPAAAAMLGMRDGATVGAAATELILAVNDPAGPRCDSYRSAVHYLRDLHGFTAAGSGP